MSADSGRTMKTPIVLALALALAALAGAEDVTLKDGRVLKNACWGEGSDSDSIVIRYDGGVARFRFNEFTPNWESTIRNLCREKFGLPVPKDNEPLAEVSRTANAGDATVFLSFGGRLKGNFSAFIGEKDKKIQSSLTFHPSWVPVFLPALNKFDEWAKVCEAEHPPSFEKDIFRYGDSVYATFSWDKRGNWESARMTIVFAVAPTGFFFMHAKEVAAFRMVLDQAEQMIEQSRQEAVAAGDFSGKLK